MLKMPNTETVWFSAPPKNGVCFWRNGPEDPTVKIMKIINGKTYLINRAAPLPITLNKTGQWSAPFTLPDGCRLDEICAAKKK